MGADGLRRGPALHLGDPRPQLVHGRGSVTQLGAGNGHPIIIEQLFEQSTQTPSWMLPPGIASSSFLV